MKGIRTQIYPTVKQKIYIDDLLGSYRFVYNKCLEFKMNEYTEKSVIVGMKELGQFVHHNLRKSSDFEFLQKHNSKVLFQTCIDLLNAYKRFFVNGAGFPKFKSKKDVQSCRFPADAVAKKAVVGNRLNLTKQLKNLKIACSDRDLKTLRNTKIKSVTIIKEKTGLYFTSFLLDIPVEQVDKPKTFTVGIDFGIKSFAKIHNGEEFSEITNPKFIRNNEKKLKKLQRNLSKKQKGSKNKEKTRIKLAKAYYKIKCQKEWFLHNFTTKTVKENQVIGIEDLSISNMLKNHKLSKALQELSLYEVKRQLLYKSLKWSRNLIQIDRFYPSSKLCSSCGWKNQDLKLSDRVFHCKECGLKIGRDENAAINIRNEALRIYSLINREELSRINACEEDIRLKSKKLGDANFVEAGR
jgi:putative transposase